MAWEKAENVIKSWSHNKKGRQRTPATISHAVRPPSGWPSSVIWSDNSSTGDCTSRSYFSFDIELQSLETRTFSTVISKFECCEFLVSQSIERQRWEGKKERNFRTVCPHAVLIIKKTEYVWSRLRVGALEQDSNAKSLHIEEAFIIKLHLPMGC